MLLVCNYNLPTGHRRNGARFLPYFSCLNRKIIPLNVKYVLVAFRWHVILRNLRRGTTESLEWAKISSEEMAQKLICRWTSSLFTFQQLKF